MPSYKGPFAADDKFFVGRKPVATVSTMMGATEEQKSKTTWPKKDADALEGALAEMGIEVRYNLRSMRAEFKEGANKWVKPATVQALTCGARLPEGSRTPATKGSRRYGSVKTHGTNT